MRMSPAEKQRRCRERKRAKILELPMIPCECGCGTLIPPITTEFKPARFVLGHNLPKDGCRFPKGHEPWNKGQPYPIASAVHKGKELSAEEIARRQATRLSRNGGKYQIKRGWKHTPETIAHMTEAVRKRDMKGAQNPFWQHSHSDETKQSISAKLSGTKHPNWIDGRGTQPYGPEFTRKFKRLIRERDNHTCQRCGKAQPENAGRALPIHHIDQDKLNNDPRNLVTVCESCHRWLDKHPDKPFQW